MHGGYKNPTEKQNEISIRKYSRKSFNLPWHHYDGKNAEFRKNFEAPGKWGFLSRYKITILAGIISIGLIFCFAMSMVYVTFGTDHGNSNRIQNKQSIDNESKYDRNATFPIDSRREAVPNIPDAEVSYLKKPTQLLTPYSEDIFKNLGNDHLRKKRESNLDAKNLSDCQKRVQLCQQIFKDQPDDVEFVKKTIERFHKSFPGSRYKEIITCLQCRDSEGIDDTVSNNTETPLVNRNVTSQGARLTQSSVYNSSHSIRVLHDSVDRFINPEKAESRGTVPVTVGEKDEILPSTLPDETKEQTTTKVLQNMATTVQPKTTNYSVGIEIYPKKTQVSITVEDRTTDMVDTAVTSKSMVNSTKDIATLPIISVGYNVADEKTHTQEVTNITVVQQPTEIADKSEAYHPAARIAGIYPSLEQQRMPEGKFDSAPAIAPTAETMKSSQQVQYTPAMAWMPYPICYYGPTIPPTGPNAPYKIPGVNTITSPSGFPVPFPPGQIYPTSVPRGPYGNLGTGQGQAMAPNLKPYQAGMQFVPVPSYAPTNFGPGFQRFEQTGPGVQNVKQPTTAFGGQRSPPYYCTYVPAPTIQFPPVPGISEYQRAASGNLADSNSQGNVLPSSGPMTYKAPDIVGYPALYRACPVNKFRCADGSLCIPKTQQCDGHVDCTDASDEMNCPCNLRIGKHRLCDGYFDCPHGEDELGCFGCPKNYFSCENNRQKQKYGNCIPLTQRCDGKRQCANGKDEMDCHILTHTFINEKDIFHVGYTDGYLHKNWQGQWYPACSPSLAWAKEACLSEIGASTTNQPFVRIMPVPHGDFKGRYIEEKRRPGVDIGINFVNTCYNNAIYVKCPPMPCGTRLAIESPTQPFDDEFVGKSTKNFKREANQTDEDTVGSDLRVVGGQESEPKAWPFLVAIYKDGVFHCGGVIINEEWVLTAAHCMQRFEEHYYEIQAGMLRRYSFSPMAQHRRALFVVVHPQYDMSTMRYDLALINVDQPFLFNRWVRPTCLPQLETAGPHWRNGPTPQTNCVTVGWGAVQEHGPDPDHVREVEVPILPYCKHREDQNDGEICAGYVQGGRDACQGDSGGPLMCRNPSSNSQWYVAGIVSHGEGCGRPGEPGAYTKVSRFNEWIETVIQRQNIVDARSQPLDTCPGFTCVNGVLAKCIPEHRQCDRIVDCMNGEDETNCAFYNEHPSYRDAEGNGNSTSSDFVKQANQFYPPTEFLNQSDATTITAEEGTNATPMSEAFTIPAELNETTTKYEKQIRRTRFTCTRLLQTIPILKRCDKIIDCEDGTDEEDCTCKEVLLKHLPNAICNGVVDCSDGTDEEDCDLCSKDEYLCRKSGDCIPREAVCDQKTDCPLNDDEMDCFALTNGKYLIKDMDDRPHLNREGILSRNMNNEWLPVCYPIDKTQNSNSTMKIAQGVCAYLGFGNIETVREVPVTPKSLEVKSSTKRLKIAYENPPKYSIPSDNDDQCMGLFIACKGPLINLPDEYSVVDPETKNNSYIWPWQAHIFVNGQYQCSGILLEQNWVFTSSRCTNNIKLPGNYTTVLLGASSPFLHVNGPYQQIAPVDEIKIIKQSDSSLFHLEKPATYTRYVLPIFADRIIYPATEEDFCVAVGTNDNHVTQTTILRSLSKDCHICHRCFVDKDTKECWKNGTSINWSGTIVCRGGGGWYPASVFDEDSGHCSFQKNVTLKSIDYINAHLREAIDEPPRTIDGGYCDGFRCSMGQCLPRDKICNGIGDCRDNEDENEENCARMMEYSENCVDDCKCKVSELRCGNGECIPKESFCNGKVDCSDGTDEPATCQCADYLKLTYPGRVCDGIRHCFDKSDEDPNQCGCKDSSFKCDRNFRGDVKCIPLDFVCDGHNDCLHGEDEKTCVRLQQDPGNNQTGVGEIIRRTYGVWHSECLEESMISDRKASEICKNLNYSSGTIINGTVIQHPPVVPLEDEFYMVRLNHKTWISMRDDKPLISLQPPEKSCHRLYVQCLNK